MLKSISNDSATRYTEWCPYCGTETDYSEEWTHVKCSGCGRWLMPCDWCHVRLNGLDKPSRPIDFTETPCGGGSLQVTGALSRKTKGLNVNE